MNRNTDKRMAILAAANVESVQALDWKLPNDVIVMQSQNRLASTPSVPRDGKSSPFPSKILRKKDRTANEGQQLQLAIK